MNRRDFLFRASLSVVALGIDPEQLLWTPGHMISVPAMPATLSMGDLVALTWQKVMDERNKDGQLFWHDRDMIRRFAREAVDGRMT